MTDAIFSWMLHVQHLLISTTQLSALAYILVFAGGLASALSPCYVPVLALFAGYVGGYASGKREAGVRLALPFVLGNAVALAPVGALAALLGGSALRVFTGYQLDRWIPGVLGLLMGLQLLGVLQLRMPQLPILQVARQPDSGSGAFALGIPFGLVVTPCTIPIFFAIVTFVAFQGNILHGVLLMVAYALGRGIILLTVAASAGLLKAMNIGKTSHYIERISGALLIVISLSLLVFYNAFVRFTGQLMPAM